MVGKNERSKAFTSYRHYARHGVFTRLASKVARTEMVLLLTFVFMTVFAWTSVDFKSFQSTSLSKGIEQGKSYKSCSNAFQAARVIHNNTEYRKKYHERRGPRPKKPSADEPSFLVYFSHSGYSNQVMGLQHAAQLAYATNRTLVLPPVLPHGWKDAQKYPQWQPAFAGSGCPAYQNFEQHFLGALKHAKIAAGLINWSEFPSFHAIMDFEALTRQTGLKAMDMDAFMKQQTKNGIHSSAAGSGFLDPSHLHSYSTNVHTWCDGSIQRETSSPSVNGKKSCEVAAPLPYNELVEQFNNHLEEQGLLSYHNGENVYMLDCQVANIGSGFLLRNEFEGPSKGIFDRFFDNYPLVSPWNEIVKTILDSIPGQSFTGVHVRIQDGEQGCPYLLYHGAAEELLNKLGANDNNNNNNPLTVVIGRVSKNSKDCMIDAVAQEMRSKNSSLPMPSVKTVNDLIEDHPKKEKLNEWIDRIGLETSTSYLLLDQIILALAKDLVMKCAYAGSTFQRFINERHAYRNENMDELGF